MKNKYLIYTLSSSDDPNNIRYVGVTSTTLRKRLTQHRYCAKHKFKRGLPVHKWMFSKYSQKLDIIITQIDVCDNNWQEKEQYWIQYYKCNGYQLMNIDKGGNGIVTKEQRSKDSITRSVEKHCKSVIALTLDGKFVKEFDSITKAATEMGIKNIQNIDNVLRGINKSCKNYLWVFKNDYDKNK